MTPEGEALLLQGTAELGLTVEDHLPAFAHLLELLVEANSRVNLTALKTEAEIILKHFVDSLTCLRGGHLNGEGQVLDLGTGAGFPALPLAIMQPGATFTPLDSIRKKIDFVRGAADALNLPNVTPLVGRAETLGRDPEHRERYDRVVCRAVAALPILAELALPLLRPGGLVVAQKGPISEEELRAGRRAAGEVGGRVTEVDAFTLPVLGDARTLIVMQKVGATPGKYPRREGVPNQQPLFWTAR
ncbi:16S rRNA (guanine(527)-N(7))-methyltransferase RsmG [Deinococcus taeanensis]|uniref:16S rRNA (guanine(527)-N(7))-methyltransferase RsmG n=1 Tax=Deinococcus taeanensis TaxID=2737050 RepID=UPI001CDC6355|nr:16S rRNA (guanine(527)-N(7))-methyltransferase RsmG [Deinococcus taeanensis]UBV42522.1 16S rRNA (guanine(527)-N(7))-methyltransferase RsmG [Deinococcus taeanensis]